MISVINASRHYIGNGRVVRAVDEVSLELARDDFVCFTGPSGCGKSTLMHLLAGLDQPTSGEVWFENLPLHCASDRALTAFRRRDLGIVFQFFNLLPTMTVLENVAFPLLLQHVSYHESHRRAFEVIQLVGLAERASQFPDQLSGGEQQRTAIARALVHRPRLLIADEPTGNLDSQSAAAVLHAIGDVAESGSAAVVLVTHSKEVAQLARRRFEMQDGRIIRESR